MGAQCACEMCTDCCCIVIVGPWVCQNARMNQPPSRPQAVKTCPHLLHLADHRSAAAGSDVADEAARAPGAGAAAGWPVQWAAPARVRAWCSTRTGGVSVEPYASLNLGAHVGDDAAAVAVNRTRYAQSLQVQTGTTPVRPVFLQQVHGCAVLTLSAATSGGTADAALTCAPGLACTVMVADCLPVLLCDVHGRAVVAAHAGWRGLLGQAGHGVLHAAVQALSAQAHIPAQRVSAEVLAWLGPCIGPEAFEVGAEVRDAFVGQWADAAPCFQAGRAGHWWANLPGLARLTLRRLGVTQVAGNDASAAWCTHRQVDRFFSHRRDGCSGRMAASVWLLP